MTEESVCQYCNKRIESNGAGYRPNVNSHIEEQHIGLLHVVR